MMRKPCKFADVKPDIRGRIVMRKDHTYKCTVPLPDIALPTSVTRAYGFRWPPHRTNVDREQCEECPCWTAREENTNKDDRT